MRKHFQRLLPGQLKESIDAHARALVTADEPVAARLAEPDAREAQRSALAALGVLLPLDRCEVIARARLGLHYIVKLRFHGAGGQSVTFQARWHQNAHGEWRIIELNDLGVHSPWKKPDKPTVEING